MGVLDGDGDRRREKGSLVVNLGSPIVAIANGGFVVWTHSSQIILGRTYLLYLWMTSCSHTV